MDKATKTKFAIVLIIGVVLLTIIITNQFGGNVNHEIENSFSDAVFPEETISSEIEVDTAHEEMEIQVKEEDDEVIVEEPNFESEYASIYGDKAVEKGKKAVKKIVTLWLEEETAETKWKPYSSSSFLNARKKDLLPSGDGVSRKVVELEMHAASPGSKKVMRFGVVATWDVVHDNSLIGKQTQLFYVTVVPYKNSWVVNKLVQPSEEKHPSTKQ